MLYQIHEVDGATFAETISEFNALIPEWPELQPRHFQSGFWWIAHYTGCPDELIPIAFAGLVPMDPFIGYGYLKRCLVLPDHHGHGLQFRMMCARELKARQLGWTHLVSECGASNSFSAGNFRRAGFERFEPEQRWGEPNSIFWIKNIAR